MKFVHRFIVAFLAFIYKLVRYLCTMVITNSSSEQLYLQRHSNEYLLLYYYFTYRHLESWIEQHWNEISIFSKRMMINSFLMKRGGLFNVIPWFHTVDPFPCMDMFLLTIYWQNMTHRMPGLLLSAVALIIGSIYKIHNSELW